MTDKQLRYLRVIYLLVGIYTFGHAAVNQDCPQKEISFCMERAPVAGTIAAVMWPLYWSWEVQQ